MVRYNAAGEYTGQLGDGDNLIIPHSLALAEDLDLLCVADRENNRCVTGACCHQRSCFNQVVIPRNDFPISLPIFSNTYVCTCTYIYVHVQVKLYGCFIRIMCYNAGLKDENKFGELEREYMDPSNARVYAIEYNAQSKLRTCFCIMHVVRYMYCT